MYVVHVVDYMYRTNTFSPHAPAHTQPQIVVSHHLTEILVGGVGGPLVLFVTVHAMFCTPSEFWDVGDSLDFNWSDSAETNNKSMHACMCSLRRNTQILSCESKR